MASDDATFTLEPFALADWPAARAQLLAGYPHTPAAWWDAGHARLKQVPPAGADAPLGVLLRRGGQDVGVLLLLHSRRAGEAEQPWHVCASNFAISPDHRERALWMTRRATADQTKIYTAITPITSVVRMAQRLGFTASAHQCIVGFTPRLQGAAGAATPVLWGDAALQALRDHPLAGALEDHHRLGCLVSALQAPSGMQPLVWRSKRRLRALRSAELLYTPSQALVNDHVGALARGLLRRGYAALEFEAHEDLVPAFSCTRLFQRRFARGPYRTAGIDHLYSELVYLHR